MQSKEKIYTWLHSLEDVRDSLQAVIRETPKLERLKYWKRYYFSYAHPIQENPNVYARTTTVVTYKEAKALLPKVYVQIRTLQAVMGRTVPFIEYPL